MGARRCSVAALLPRESHWLDSLAAGAHQSRLSLDGLIVTAVDIIVPVYGAAAAARRCIESVLASRQQQPFELVVIDDANVDPDLVRYLRGLAELGRVTLLEQPVHAGFA